MANKNVARQRWKKSIRDHIEAVPQDAVKRNVTLVYRLRGEGYRFDEETGYWFYIADEKERHESIEAYQRERAGAQALLKEAEAQRKEAKRKSQIKVVSVEPGHRRHISIRHTGPTTKISTG